MLWEYEEAYEGAACQWHAFSADRSGAETDSRPPDLRECGVMAAHMLREHEEAFESHIFDPAATSAYKENRHSLRMAATQGTLTSEQNIFGNIA